MVDADVSGLTDKIGESLRYTYLWLIVFALSYGVMIHKVRFRTSPVSRTARRKPVEYDVSDRVDSPTELTSATSD
jgi:hypothetical protein